MTREVVRMDDDLREAFLSLHCKAKGAGWCRCVAWWVPYWEGWGDRSAAENLALREELWARGENDGYLLRVDGVVVGWCQVMPRDRLPKLAQQYARPADPTTWAITCLLVAPEVRRQGHARYLLDEVLFDLPGRGARRVEAFPRRGTDLEVEDLWTGPEELFLRAGFEVIHDDPTRPVLALDL